MTTSLLELLIAAKKSLQIILNKVARVVTKLDWSTSTELLLRQMGWLSVNQLIFYHSVLLVYKVKMSQRPRYLVNMFSWSYQFNTRQAESGLIKHLGKPKLDISKNSFKWRAAKDYNQLPVEIRASPTISLFKSRVKGWIREYISVN